MPGWRALIPAGLVTGCFLYTSRPAYEPLVGVQRGELRLAPDAATERLAEALKSDSIPVSRIEERDGYLETPWFDAGSGKPAGGSPLGRNVVRVRGWIDPGRIGHSDLAVEVAYRAFRDPSLPERELERVPPASHPVMMRVKSVIDSLQKRFGDPTPPPPADTTEPGVSDTTRQPRDSVRPRRPSPSPRAGPG